MIDIKKYVAYIVSSKEQNIECHGVGVLVDNMLITAGHVVDSATNVIASFEDTSYALNHANQLFLQSMGNDDKDPMHNDIAIYRIEDRNSPLKLSDTLPVVNQSFSNVYFEEQSVVSEDKTLPEFLRTTTTLSVEQSESTYVGLVEGNFIGCNTEKILHEGNSGCPIIEDDIVYGILHGGIPGEHTCFYQSSKSIMNCINNLKVLS